jgi:hypothetical protein
MVYGRAGVTQYQDAIVFLALGLLTIIKIKKLTNSGILTVTPGVS